jgi:hypothetical protein
VLETRWKDGRERVLSRGGVMGGLQVFERGLDVGEFEEDCFVGDAFVIEQ